MIKKIILFLFLFIGFSSNSYAFTWITTNTWSSSLLSWIPIIEITNDDIFKDTIWNYSFLDSENFNTNISWNGLITWSGYSETITLTFDSSNPQLKTLITLLYDIKVILIIFFCSYLFFKFIKFLRQFFYTIS